MDRYCVVRRRRYVLWWIPWDWVYLCWKYPCWYSSPNLKEAYIFLDAIRAVETARVIFDVIGGRRVSLTIDPSSMPSSLKKYVK